MRGVLLVLLFSGACLANYYGARSRRPLYRRRMQDERAEWPGNAENEIDYREMADLAARELERDLFEQAAAERFRRQDPGEECVQGDIIFILDSSGSIGDDNWQFVRKFVSDSVARMTIGPYGTHVGCVTFGNRGHIIFNLNSYTSTADIQNAVATIPFLDQNTNTSGGLWMAKDIMFTPANGDRSKAPNIAIVVTDGESTYDHNLTIPYAQEMKAAGILIISIGVGNLTSPDELNGMASDDAYGNPLVYQVGSYAMLATMQDKLAQVACEADTATTTMLPVVPPDNNQNPPIGPMVPVVPVVPPVVDTNPPVLNPLPPVPPPIVEPPAPVIPVVPDVPVVTNPPIIVNPPNPPAHLDTTPLDTTNGCLQDFGPNCPNACSQTGGTCCWCNKAAQNLGLTQTCSCCPAGFQCCPSANAGGVPKCCPSDSICGPAGSDGCYVISQSSKLGTVECANCATYWNPPRDLPASNKSPDVCNSLCKP